MRWFDIVALVVAGAMTCLFVSVLAYYAWYLATQYLKDRMKRKSDELNKSFNWYSDNKHQ